MEWTRRVAVWAVICGTTFALVGCGGGSAAPSPNPVPSISAITPTNAIAGGAAFTLTTSGSKFLQNSTVEFNGSPRATTFVSGTELNAAITAADVAAASSAQITVTNPSPGGGTSNQVKFTVKALLSIQITPANPSILVGTTQQFTATGTYSDGSTGDLTNVVAWSSSDPSATVSNGGQATAGAIGRPQITATSGMVSVTTTLIVVIGQSLPVSRFAYATDLLEGAISIYTVDSATGLLRHAGYAEGNGGGPIAIAVSPTGKYAYTADNGGTVVTGYNIDASTGALKEMADSPFLSGLDPGAIVVDPS
jgi:hypothetical protein